MPCADSGIRHTVAALAPARVVAADREQAGELALRPRVGLQRHRVVAGDLAQRALRARRTARGSPRPGRAGANGCMAANSGHVIGIISVVALSFIVHDPSGIIVRSSARSRSASVRRYRSICVSEWYLWNTGCVRISDVRRSAVRERGVDVAGPLAAVDAERAPDAVHDVGGRGLVERDADVSSSATRRLTRSSARVASTSARPGTCTATVSKHDSCRTSSPPARRPSASVHVNQCTRRAISRRPSGHKISLTSVRIGDGFPHASVNGRYGLEPASWWTAGFWPGILWLIYRDTRDDKLRALAESCEARLERVMMEYVRLDHDIGFMWSLTGVARFKLLGDEASKRRALMAANLLSGRFNVKGRFIRAWNSWKPDEDNSGWAIIDCMMNLSILHWASEVTGDPRYKHIAIEHSDTALRHFIRPDGSAYHIVIFDPETGEKIGVHGGQGYGPESAWSRGSAWALYGMALSFRYTGEERYLQAAKRIAHFFIANLPKDHVPYWDFRLPPDIVKQRDSSAGACAAAGLLLLARMVDELEKPLFRNAAERILYSLYMNYGAWDRDEEGLILEGTSHYPEGKNIGVPLIYGDYFFVEGISQLIGYDNFSGR